MGLLNVKWTCLGDWDCLPGTVRLDQSHLPHQPPVFHRQSLGAYLIGKTLGLFSFFQGVELGGLLNFNTHDTPISLRFAPGPVSLSELGSAGPPEDMPRPCDSPPSPQSALPRLVHRPGRW